jgi:NAD(P)-dependent dehydrogenase (short-subunit alcohol dehydrogenase family)
MGVNLRGNFLLTKALIPHMISDRWGRFVHISSLGGMEGNPGTIAYSTSKAGLVGMSRVLAKEYARFNITSNILVLGAFETGMYLKLPDELKKEILDRIPSRSLGNVSNIVNAVDFLIKSEYVNASVINIDGGM